MSFNIYVEIADEMKVKYRSVATFSTQKRNPDGKFVKFHLELNAALIR